MSENLIAYFLEEQTGKTIIDSLPIASYITDLKGRIKYYNSAAAELWGQKHNPDTQPWNNFKLYDTDGTSISAEENPLTLFLKEEESHSEYEIIAEQKGERRWLKIYQSWIHNEDGKAIGTLNMLIDVTNQKEIEEQIRKNESELSDFFDNTTVGLHQTNSDGIIKRANQTLLDMLGYSREELVGRPIADLHADQEALKKIMETLSEGKEIHDYEIRLKHKDGSIRHVLLNSSGYWKDGEFVHSQCITRDITERKQAKRALRKSEERYRTLIERMDDGFVILKMEFDEDNNPVDWLYLETNPAANKHAGLGDREGKKVSEVLPDLEQDWLEIYGKVAMTGEAVQFENYHTNLERWFEISAFRIGDPEERKVAIFFKNITERKQAQEKLKKINENLEERVKERTQELLSYQEQLRSLAYQLSRTEENQRQQLATELHDNLGQMLALGKMKVNELQRGHFTDKVTPAIDDLKKIMDNAITYTQEMTSDLKPPPSVGNDLRASINWLAEKMSEHGLDVTIDDDAQSKLLDDEVRTTVLQSIRELLFNVIKHTSEKKATVHLRNIEDQLQVTVADEGKGFNSENKQLASIKDGRFGLFNIHERIDLLGGRIDIKSEQGLGTKVSLFVPLSKESKSGKKVKKPETDGSTTEIKPLQIQNEEKIKVLLADDHKMFRNGLRKIIMDEDDIVVVGEAGNGEEAVTLCRKTSPDVILMDVSMPKMDGIEATEKITSNMPGVRIIGVSLHDSQEVMQDMRDAGASAYLTKTEAFESLIVTIRAEASASTEDE